MTLVYVPQVQHALNLTVMLSSYSRTGKHLSAAVEGSRRAAYLDGSHEVGPVPLLWGTAATSHQLLLPLSQHIILLCSLSRQLETSIHTCSPPQATGLYLCVNASLQTE